MLLVQQVTTLRPGCLKPCEYRAGRVWRRDNCALAQHKPVGLRVSALTTSGLKPATLKGQSEATTVGKHSPRLNPLHQSQQSSKQSSPAPDANRKPVPALGQLPSHFITVHEVPFHL